MKISGDKLKERSGMTPVQFLKLINRALERFNRTLWGNQLYELDGIQETMSFEFTSNTELRVAKKACGKGLCEITPEQVFQCVNGFAYHLGELDSEKSFSTQGWSIMDESLGIGLSTKTTSVEVVFTGDLMKTGHYDIVDNRLGYPRYLRIHGDGYCGWYAAIYVTLCVLDLVEESSFESVPAGTVFKDIQGGFLHGRFITMKTINDSSGGGNQIGVSAPSLPPVPDCSGDAEFAARLAAREQDLEGQRQIQEAADRKVALDLSLKLNGCVP